MSNEPNNNILRYAGLATQWMVLMGIAAWGGLKLDRWIHIRALFVFVLPLIALTFSLWQLIKIFNKPKQ